MPDLANSHGLHEGQPVLRVGQPLESARAALILLHGRGASAQHILTLADELPHPALTTLAPQAAGSTWYPYRFIEPRALNEPSLSSALALIESLTARVQNVGIPAKRILIGGFSQGACLAAEFVARHPRRWGGLFVLSGGLIGAPGELTGYSGSLEGTPVVIGCSDIDPHVPLERVQETSAILTGMGARVTEHIYPGLGHVIVQDELDHMREVLAEVVPAEA